MFTGTRDVLNVDAHRLAAKASAEGVTPRSFEYPRMPYVRPLSPVPETGRAAEEIAAFRERPEARRAGLGAPPADARQARHRPRVSR